jgi:glycosyl transferase family 2
MGAPFFSIVIPTRNRGNELYHTLRTCLEQDFAVFGSDSFEIVVSDNASEDDIQKIVERFSSDRIRYVRTRECLSMTDSWEFALSHIRGKYVGFVCTDDGYLLNALSNVYDIISKTGAEVVTFQGAHYYWPSCNDPELKDKLLIPRFIFHEGMEPSQQLIAESLNSLYYGRLPCFLNSFCSTDVIMRVRGQTGRIFRSFCPDVYAGFSIAAHIPEIYVSNRLMLVGGVSGASTGSNVFRHPTGATMREHVRLHEDESLGQGLMEFPFVSNYIVDSALKALAYSGDPSPMDKVNIRQYVVHCYRQATQLPDRAQRAQAIASIRKFIQKHPQQSVAIRRRLILKKLQWALQRYLPYWLRHWLQRAAYRRNSSSGGLENKVVLAHDHGIENIYDAALFVTRACRN